MSDVDSVLQSLTFNLTGRRGVRVGVSELVGESVGVKVGVSVGVGVTVSVSVEVGVKVGLSVKVGVSFSQFTGWQEILKSWPRIETEEIASWYQDNRWGQSFGPPEALAKTISGLNGLGWW